MISEKQDPRKPITLSIDADGGDLGVEVTISGAAEALARDGALSFEFHGIESPIVHELEKYPQLKAVSKVVPAEISIAMDAKPSQALKAGRGKSGMWNAIESTKEGNSQAAISAGNTGALMVMALLCLRRSAEIDRPALAGLWPTLKKPAIALDLGASPETDAVGLVHQAVMGAAMSRVLFGIETPKVALLNIGEEETKGLGYIQEAGKILGKDPGSFHYSGYIEGTNIGKGEADVVVASGFAGNLALKSAEGTASQIGSMLREAFTGSWRGKLAYLIAKPALDRLRQNMNPNNHNGAVFLGLNGLVVKSHGGTTPEGFAAAIRLSVSLARANIVERIQKEVHDINERDLKKSVQKTKAENEETNGAGVPE